VRPIYQFGQYGTDIDKMIDPMGMDIDNQGTIYVSDCGNNRIKLMSINGSLVETLPHKQSIELSCPQGVSLASDGSIYVSDTGKHRVVGFDSAGNVTTIIGKQGSGNGQFNEPIGVEFNKDRIYVADSGNNRIQVFDINGTFQFAFGEYGSEPGKFNVPSDIAIDDGNFIYVTDSFNNRVQKFDSQGQFVKSWGTYGSYSGQFAEPRNIDYDNGEIMVADLVNHRIQAFDTDGNYLYQFGRHPPSAHEGNGRIHYPMVLSVNHQVNVAGVCEPFENRCQVFSLKDVKNMPPVNDSAWWSKATKFHYGSREVVSQIVKPEADMTEDILNNLTKCSQIAAITEPDTHFVVKLNVTQPNPEADIADLIVPQFVGRIGGFGHEEGKFILPSGGAIDPIRCKLYISDGGNNRIQVFNIKGNGTEYVTSFGTLGSGPGEFNSPADITLDQQGNLYVLDVHNARVEVFNPEFKFLREWGKPGNQTGEFNTPLNIEISKNNTVYVVDSYNYRIQAFKTDGSYLTSWGGPGVGNARFIYPFGIAIDEEGYVFVSDADGQKIKKFDSNGNFILQWGKFGNGPGEFYKPKGIAFDLHGRLLVIDFGNHRGQMFTSDGVFLGEFGLTSFPPPPNNISR